ncbi:unnamed protein product [Clonostachys rosea f. rosea IK726]|uniref:Regulator of phospholipase D SRF1 n=2 Tax=Bionectria ochroleuca TaxID=29856 RepID=A0A0B7JHD5_BIOOC|nr:unnamed protein product [Clonostachys rosea f. rosea IK726]
MSRLSHSNSSDGQISENHPSSTAPSGSTVPPQSETRLRAPRSLPPWIDSYEERYGPAPKAQLDLLRPPNTTRPHRNSAPSEPKRRVSKDGFIDWEDAQLGPGQRPRGAIPHILRYGRATKKGRKWDHLRSAEPVVVSGYVPSTISGPPMAWRDFIHASKYGPLTGEESEIMNHSDLEKLQPNFDQPVRGAYNPLDIQTSRRRRAIAPYKRIWNLVMRHPFSPLLFRLIVMVTSILALGVAGRIFYLVEHSDNKRTPERSQAVMAIVVDCVALPYIAYMIWDEYTGKPLGLRSVVSKVSLILLDLFFIIFKSASTALAFSTLIFHGSSNNDGARALGKALAAFMLMALISWTINFIINIFRTVGRLGRSDDERG